MATYDEKFGGRTVSANQYGNQSVPDVEDADSSAACIAVGVRNTSAEDVVPLESPQQLSDENTDVQSASVVLIRGCGCCAGGQWRAYGSLAVLSCINLLNYMDRFTLAGVLNDIQKFYGINDSESGFLQSSFIISYMVFSMLFGYLGDRFNRKIIMAGGILFWSAITLGSSFVSQQYFNVFIVTRALVGIGEASYSTIAPTVLADLFVGEARTMALAVFYFAIPVGSGLGYIVGSEVAAALHNWQWALRITPCLGILCLILILFVVYEPARGEAEGGTVLAATSWFSDIKYLLCNKSFVLSSLGFTCVAFVTGALAFWAPAFMSKAAANLKSGKSDADLSLIFGIITCVAGIAGVTIGTQVASRLRKRGIHDADPLVCAVGLITGTPFLFVALVIARYNISATWFCIFVAETLLFFNWALITDILMYVVIPTRRSTAEAVQILLSHTLGDASSPYLIGLISDKLKHNAGDFGSLQCSLYVTPFVCALGAAFFFATTLYVHKDRRAADSIVAQSIYNRSISEESDQRAIRDDHDALAI